MKPDTGTRNIIIEQDKRFSESLLWRIQRNYFDREGINAWVSQVPFYITSNPFIAKTYARIYLAFLHDWVQKHPESRKTPFYILEIGAGSGRFSYYFVKTLHEILKASPLQDVQVIHVMSDFTRSNMRYWEKHHALQPLVEQGLIEFALYDMESERPITLAQSRKTLNTETLGNPLTVIGNYIFDTCLNDLYALRNGQCHELHVSLSSPESNMKDNWPVEMEKVEVSYHPHKIPQGHYGDSVIDGILDEYCKHTQRKPFFYYLLAHLKQCVTLKKYPTTAYSCYQPIKAIPIYRLKKARVNHPFIFMGLFFPQWLTFTQWAAI